MQKTKQKSNWSLTCETSQNKDPQSALQQPGPELIIFHSEPVWLSRLFTLSPCIWFELEHLKTRAHGFLNRKHLSECRTLREQGKSSGTCCRCCSLMLEAEWAGRIKAGIRVKAEWRTLPDPPLPTPWQWLLKSHSLKCCKELSGGEKHLYIRFGTEGPSGWVGKKPKNESGRLQSLVPVRAPLPLLSWNSICCH